MIWHFSYLSFCPLNCTMWLLKVALVKNAHNLWNPGAYYWEILSPYIQSNPLLGLWAECNHQCLCWLAITIIRTTPPAFTLSVHRGHHIGWFTIQTTAALCFLKYPFVLCLRANFASCDLGACLGQWPCASCAWEHNRIHEWEVKRLSNQRRQIHQSPNDWSFSPSFYLETDKMNVLLSWLVRAVNLSEKTNNKMNLRSNTGLV